MEPKIEEFLTRHHLAVLSIVTRHGNPYSAAVHYSHTPDPLRFYFLTDKRTKKVEGLLDGTTTQASLVIGFTEGEWLTFQAQGVISLVTMQQNSEAETIYYLKYPNAQRLEKDPNLILLQFTPLHWKFTNLNPDIWEITTSEE